MKTARQFIALAACVLFAVVCYAQEKLPPSPVDDVGVYYWKDGKWEDLSPEVVNWKTGGVFKSVASFWVVKGDVNGELKGKASKTELNLPTELLVHTLEGAAISEYQLIRLHDHSSSREFRTVTGGVLHVSGGSERDTLEYESKHIAQRTWTIPLDNLKPGEYGLLPPGVMESRSPSAQLGKMYTFSVPSASVDVAHMTAGARDGHSGARNQATSTSLQTESIGEAALLGVSGYATESGLKITSVRAGSPAAQSYLSPGDTILKIDGRDIHSSHDIEVAVAASTSGTVKVILMNQTRMGSFQSEREVKVR